MNSPGIRIAAIDELPEGKPRVYQVGELYIAVCKVNGEVYALEDRCTHDDGPLASGCLYDYELECPRHGARFDIRDGSICRMPAYGEVPTFKVRVDGTDVFISLPPEEPGPLP